MLQADNISFSYGKRAILKDVSFLAEDGECLVVTGENGSGKSTLLSILSGALKPDRGSVKANGRIGLVPQGNSIFDDMTVRENLRFFAGLSGRKMLPKIPFDLEQYASVKAGKLSGGYKKRLNVACTLVTGPQIWLFDEPCANLDEKWREEMIHLVHLCKQKGCTVLFVSHDQKEYETFCDRIIHIEDGIAEITNKQQ